ncbi:MAG: glycosyltransferase family 2 protein [Actinomycetia bacterium]|nr:glycosyltransferase family 2 protein [Actinomycetes bacterium]
MIVLIPSYEPDHRLVRLLTELRQELPQAEVLVVDDGSGPRYRPVVAEAAAAGATVIAHDRNRGKGAALKTGLRWVTEHAPGSDVVCADSDGQHRPYDVARVAAAVRPGTMVLGGRRFTGRVPLRSRFGNTVTRHLFRLVTGTDVYDTQTGLRGYPYPLLEWLLRVPGERFEYELSALLAARGAGVEIVEVEIETVYEARHSSHFRTVSDSWRVYAPMLAFAGHRLQGR